MIRLSTVALTAALVASATTAMAQERVKVGMLDCRGSTSSFVLGSVTELGCTFIPSAGPSEGYRATIRRFGVDIGVAQQIAVSWAVFAPTRGFQRGGLAGNYAGGSASATVGVGVGANALIGGSGNTIALQPVSLQGQTGLSAAAGIADMELRASR
jgi:hypothetical protein